jgi:site-specific recombinase XerD
MLNQLIVTIPQPQPTLALDQLIAQNDVFGYFAAFLVSCKVEGLLPASIQAYRCLAGEFVKYLSRVGVSDPRQITASHVRMFILLKQQTCNSVSVHTYYRHAKRFINWMVNEGILEKSPMVTIKPPRMAQTMVKPFNVTDLRTLLALCDSETFLGTRNKAIILLFVDTGLRLAELTNIALADIDFDRGIIKVLGKGARERVVHISQNTQKAIFKYLMKRTDKLPWLWLNTERNKLEYWGVVQMVKKLGQKATLKGVRCSPHTFRHTAATLALENGALEFEVQSMLGHSTLAMTRRYVSSINSEKAAEAHHRFSPVKNLNLA